MLELRDAHAIHGFANSFTVLSHERFWDGVDIRFNAARVQPSIKRAPSEHPPLIQLTAARICFRSLAAAWL